MEESIEEYPAPTAGLDESTGGVILRRCNGRGLPDEAYGPDAPLGGPPGPERIECSGKTREMVGRDGLALPEEDGSQSRHAALSQLSRVE